jgi:hypothetical protein
LSGILSAMMKIFHPYQKAATLAAQCRGSVIDARPGEPGY